MDPSRKRVDSCVKGKSKSFPFVMLINSKNVIETSCPKVPALKLPSLALANKLGLVNSEVNNNNLPINDLSSKRLRV